MAVTVEQLQIIIEAKVNQAIDAIESVQDKLMQTVSKTMPQFNKQMKSSMDGFAAGLSHEIGKADKQIEEVKRITEAVQKQTSSLIDQQNKLRQAAEQTSKIFKNQSQTTYKKQPTQNNGATQSGKQASDIIVDSVKRTFAMMQQMEKISNNISKKAAEEINIVSEKIKEQERLLTILQKKLTDVSDSKGLSATGEIQKDMQVAEDSIKKLIDQYNKLAANANKTANEIEDAINRVKKKQEGLYKSSGEKRVPDSGPVGPTKLASQMLPGKLNSEGSKAYAKEVQQAMDWVGNSIDRINQAYEKMSKISQSAMDSVAGKLANVNEQLELQWEKYGKLQDKLENVVASEGFSEQSNKIRQQILNTESDMVKLIDKYNKISDSAEKAAQKTAEIKNQAENIQGAADNISDEFQEMSNSAEKAADSIGKVADDAKEAAQNTEKIGDAAKGAENSVKKLSSPFAKVSKSVQTVPTFISKASIAMKSFQRVSEKVAVKVDGVFSRLGKAIMAAIPFVALLKLANKFLNFISNGIKSAIDAPEIENMFRVAMGNMANEADKFAKQFKRVLGVDEYATKQMIGTFNNMISTMGIGQKTAYKMSKSLTILANDMASLYNVPVQQAYENLQSAMAGQSEAVRKYGYLLNETTIKEVALRHGLIQEGQTLNENQKVLARYLALLEQSKNAQGDMARTVNSLQNQLRILQGNITAAGRAIGQAFIPFLEAVVPWLNAFFIVLQRVGNAIAKFTYKLFGRDYDAEKKQQQEALANAGNLANSLGNVADAEKDVGDEAKKAEKKVNHMLAGFDEFEIIQSISESSKSGNKDENPNIPGLEFDVPELGIPDGESPLEKMADRIIDKLKDIFKVFRQAWENEGQNTIDAAKYAFESLLGAIKAVGASFSEVWNNGSGLLFVENILRLTQTILKIVGDIASAFRIAWEEAGLGTSVIQELFNMLNRVLELVIDIGESFRVAWWSDGRGIEIWTKILEIIRNVEQTIGNLAIRLRDAWNENDNGIKIWKHILDLLIDILGFIEKITAATAEWAANLDFGPLMGSIENLYGAYERLASVILDNLAKAYEEVLLPFGKWTIEEVVPRRIDLLASAFEFLSEIVEKAAPVLQSLWDNFLSPLAEYTGGKILEILDHLSEKLGKLFDTVKNSTVFQDLKDLIEKLSPSLLWVSERLEDILGFIIELGINIKVANITYHFKQFQDVIGAITDLLNGDFLGALTHVFDFLVGNKIERIASWLGFDDLDITAELGKITDQIANWFETSVKPWFTLEKWQELLSPIAESISKAVDQFVQNWIKPIQDWWDNHVAPWFDFDKWFEIGSNAVKGLIEGLGDIIGAAVDFGKKFIQGFKDVLGIASPSKVMAEMGGFIIQGLVQGLLEDNPVVDAVLGLVGDIKTALGGIFTYLGGEFLTSWKQKWEDVKKGFSDAWDNIKTAASEKITNFKNKMGEAINYVKNEFSTTWNQKWGEVKKGFSDAWDNIKTSASQAATNLKNNIGKALSYVKDEFVGPWKQKWDEAKKGFSDAWDNIKQKASGVAGEVKRNIDGLLTYVKNDFSRNWKNKWDDAKLSFSRAWDGIVKKAQGVAHDVSDALSDALASVKDLMGIGSSTRKSYSTSGQKRYTGGNFSYYTSRTLDIPQFASGAVLKSPTLGLMAEYSGATSNPEIVAPQDIIRDTMFEAMMPGITSLSAKIDILIQAVRENGVEINGDAKEIFKVVRKESDRYEKMTGSPAFGTF